MDLDITSLQNKVKENPFFSIEDSRVSIDTNGERLNLNFDQITNVRLIKHRNLSSKRILFFLAILFYSFYLLFFNDYFVIQLISLIIITSVTVASLLTKRFSYKLLVNIGMGGFNEVLVAKSNLPCAESFVCIFKDKKGEKPLEHSRMFDYVA